MSARQHGVSFGARFGGDDRASRLSLLRWVLGFSILSTGLHFTHNFVAIDQYPDGLVSGAVVQAAILVSWPLFTSLALYAYRLYSHGRYREAHPMLIAYGFFGLTTAGHFLDGVPDIAPFWFGTIFTDVLAGLAVLAFTVRSMRTVAPARR